MVTKGRLKRAAAPPPVAGDARMRLPSLGRMFPLALVCWVTPEPPQGLAWTDDLPVPRHCGQGWLIEKKPWLLGLDSATAVAQVVSGWCPVRPREPGQVGQRPASGS